MKTRYKIVILLIISIGGLVAMDWNWESVKAAASKIITTGTSRNTVTAVSNRNGLAGYWDFDDCDTCSVSADRSGNGNTATMYTTADTVAGDMHTTSGKIGNGATFSGTANIAAPNILLDSRSFSIGFWFNTGNLASDRALLGQSSTGGCTVKNCLHLATRSSKLMFGFYFSDLAGNATLTTNRWYHAVFVYDNSAATKYIYLDGVLDNSGASEAYLGTSGNTKIGSDCCDSGFIGTIDDVKIYTRAIGADEVKQIYNNSARKMLLNKSQNSLLAGGLIGSWSFNGPDMSGVTAYDRSGNGNNGTLTSGPVATPGVVGQALEFTSSASQYITIPYNSVFDFGSGNFSFAAWFRRDGTGTGGEHVVGRYGGVASEPRWGFKTSGGIAQVFIVDSDGVGHDFSSNYTVTNGQWYHGVGVVDRTNNIARIYIDGVQQNTRDISSFTGTFSSEIGAVEIGRVSGNYFKGAIDEVRLYNRALSAAEILQLYNAGKR